MKSVVRRTDNFTTCGRVPEPSTATVQMIQRHNNTQRVLMSHRKPVCFHRNF